MSQVTLFGPPDRPATPQRRDVTEFYGMTGTFLGSVNTLGKSSRYLVDEVAFQTYLGTHPAGDPDDPAAGPAFVNGLVSDLKRQAGQTGAELIASERALRLDFVGDAGDVTLSGKTRQVGHGTLNVLATFSDGRTVQVARFSAVSGPMRNGLIPNGRYTAYAPHDAKGTFPDETGQFGFKMVLEPLARINRGDFRIHSTFDPRVIHGLGMTEGCIGLDGGDGENVGFFTGMSAYFRSHRAIDVTVAIDGNADVTTQLGDAPHY